MIKAILFDLDGTLRHNVPTGDQISTKCINEMGLSVSREAFLRAERWEHYYFAYSPEIRADIKTFTDHDVFWTNFGRRRLVALGVDPKLAVDLAPKVFAYMEENYNPASHVPDEIFSLLSSLKEDGYILGVVSNRDHPFQDELKELKLESYFKFSLAGGEIQCFKPDARIFEHALGLSETSAHETMYVGDNYFADAIGSRRAGLMPVLFDPRGLFPEADCTVIKAFAELPALLE